MKVLDIERLLHEKSMAYKIYGDVDIKITGFSSIYNYKDRTMTWLRNYSTIISQDFKKPECISCLISDSSIPKMDFVKCQIIVADPRKVFFDIVDFFWGDKDQTIISPRAVIYDGAEIGERTSVGDFTTISAHAKIGNDCKIGSNVSIKGNVKIGDRCVIQSGSVIGEDGFAFAKENGHPQFIKHYGGVEIGDDVSIGSCTCVCRGTIDDTVICDEVKIDNLCHIAHNVIINKRSIIIAGTVVMGSVHVGEDCWIATSMIRDQKHVGDGVVVGMGSVVVKDVADRITVAGSPAKPFERKEKI